MAIFCITITWNGKHHLEKLYPTFKKARERLSSHAHLFWFIRDNGSTDGTEDLIKSWHDDYIYCHEAGHNRDNYAKCNNDLIEEINKNNPVNQEKDYYLFLNNDIEIKDPASINYMLDIAEKDNTVGAVGAKLYYPGPTKMIQHFGVCGSPKHGNLVWNAFSGQHDSIHTQKDRLFQAATGAFLLVRAKCFHALECGKMDERYIYCFDDVCMGFDISIRQGMNIVCCAKTNIIHYESATLAKNPINKMFMGQNVNLLKKQWGGKFKLDYLDYMDNPEYNIYKRGE